MKRKRLFLMTGIMLIALVSSLSAVGVKEYVGPTKDAVETAVTDGRFSTLVAAIQAAGLVDTLKGPGPFTVFAPTDAAFAKLPAGTVDSLLKDIPALKRVLLYHVVPANVKAAQVVNLSSAETASGDSVSIAVKGGVVTLNGSVKVTSADVLTTNGVIHVIDSVLIPPAVSADVSPSKDIVDIAVEDGRFKTLVTAVKAAGLVDTLKSAGPFTVFAPTDDAFGKLPAGTVQKLLLDIPTLKDILLYHVVQGRVKAADVVNLTSAAAVSGKTISVAVRNGEVFLNNDAKVIITDIMASNGVIHVIDRVIIPE